MTTKPLAAMAVLGSLSLLVAAPGSAAVPRSATLTSHSTAADAVAKAAAKPRIAYAFAAHPRFQSGDWRLVEPSGTSHKLPNATWGTFVVRGRSAVGAYATEGMPAYVVQRVTATGKVSRLHAGDGGFGLAVSPDKSIVGWPSDDGGVLTLGSDGRLVQLPIVPIAKGSETPVVEAIEGSGTCQEEEPEGGGCAAYVGQPQAAKVWVTTSHGIVQRVPHIAAVADASRGRLIGPVPGMGEQECSGLLGPAYRRVWRTCTSTLHRFSPGGRYVVGTADHYGAKGRLAGGTVSVYDAQNGQLEAGWLLGGRRGDRIDDVVWEDASHLLVTKYDRYGWSLVRLSVRIPPGQTGDGVQVVRGPVEVGTADVSPFNLPAR